MDAPSDTMQMAPAPSATGIALGDMKGEWRINAMPLDRDTILVSHQLWASDDTAAWRFKFDGRSDTIKVNVIAVEGDSIRVRVGPYLSGLRKDVQVVSDIAYRLQGGKLLGHITAHYAVPTADSLVHLRSEGTRVQ